MRSVCCTPHYRVTTIQHAGELEAHVYLWEIDSKVRPVRAAFRPCSSAVAGSQGH